MPLLRPNHVHFLELTSRRTRILTALSLLRDAWEGAGDLHLDPQQFALEVGQLHAAGLTNTDLRWLIGKGFVEHLHERPERTQDSRVFRKAQNLSISPASCFVLTDEGCAAASGWAETPSGDSCRPGGGEGNRPPEGRRGRGNWEAAPGEWGATPLPTPHGPTPLGAFPKPLDPAGIQPRWDGGLRELWWDGVLVKRFRLPALNQETILSAFEEEGWPPHVDDPLPPAGEMDAKVRLRDAIKGLNRNQLHACLRFGGDGTGRSIVWAATARQGGCGGRLRPPQQGTGGMWGRLRPPQQGTEASPEFPQSAP